MMTPPRQTGFTLLELLAALALLVVLAALLFPVAGRVASKSQSVQCVANLRAIGAASMAFAGEHRGLLPNFYYATEPGGAEQTPSATVGQWFWHLAPYVGVPRWERARMNLGEQNSDGVPLPCVFLCPAANAEREDQEERFMKSPSIRPVTYAPSSRARGEAIPPPAGLEMPPTVATISPPRLGAVRNPGGKIWISDSVGAGILNISAARWAESYGRAAWPYQAFTRHQGGGNALFYDGHIAWVPITRFTQSPEESLPKAVSALFSPDTE